MEVKYEKKLKKPWEKYYNKNKKIKGINASAYEFLVQNNQDNLNSMAINYFNNKLTFEGFFKEIDLCAKAFKSNGIRSGDIISICMTNTPEAIISFYAINKIGAIANMIHPLSAEEEIKKSLIETNSVMIIAVNVAYKKIKNILKDTNIYKTIIVSPNNSMPLLLKIGYKIKDNSQISNNSNIIKWNKFMLSGKTYNSKVSVKRHKDDVCVILHSGGTTGTPKNIQLTNGNINALAKQSHIVLPTMGKGDNFLSIMPLFHCFGLVVSVHCPLTGKSGITLVPKFDSKRFDKLITSYNPSIIAGVPTLYEAMITNKNMNKVDLSNIKIVLSGGDTLSIEKNKEINNFLKEHGCKSKITQGYGLTETSGPVAFSTEMGSIGIPLPSNNIKIVNPYTHEDVKFNEVGEIIVSGPTVMKGYLDNDKETKAALEIDNEKKIWVHTGDLGRMTKDGTLIFEQRMKRMLVVSGYNVYPSHIEEILLKHPYIESCGIIGIPHPYKIQVPKAFIVLKSNIKITNKVKKDISDYCEKNLAKYMIPKEFVYKESLPKTIIGKINYLELEKEAY